MKTLFQKKLEKLNRKYYEVFGDLEAQNEFLKLMTVILVILAGVISVGTFLVAQKPPVVIRVSEIGKTQVLKDIKVNNRQEAPEILFFAKSFLKRYTEYNAYTVSRDFAEAFNMMTSRYQRIAKRDLVESGFLARIKESGLSAQVEFKEETLERETPEFSVVSLIFVRTLTSYKNPDYKDSGLFKAEIVLKKLPRTIEIPAGLLVEEFREFLLNRIENK